jgi:hypothetical protein
MAMSRSDGVARAAFSSGASLPEPADVYRAIPGHAAIAPQQIWPQ